MSSVISAAQNGSNETIIGLFGLSVDMEKPYYGTDRRVIQKHHLDALVAWVESDWKDEQAKSEMERLYRIIRGWEE